MLFSLSLGDFKDKCRCDDGRVIFSERIVAIFSNGTSQVRVYLRAVFVDPTKYVFECSAL